jgi:hypothetical protein
VARFNALARVVLHAALPRRCIAVHGAKAGSQSPESAISIRQSAILLTRSAYGFATNL